MKDRIILRYTYRNHLDIMGDYQEEFASIHDLRNYLRWIPERAMAIGYIPAVEETLKKARSSNVRLSIFSRGEEMFFGNVHEFVRFLQEHHEIAKAVQYSRPTNIRQN